MSAISDIRHRHLLFQYRREICRTEKRHSDIGSVLISTSEFIPISDIEEKKFPPCEFEPAHLLKISKRYTTVLLCLSVLLRMSDIWHQKKCIPISDIMSDSALSVRYQKFRYQTPSVISDHGYRTKCPPMTEDSWWLVTAIGVATYEYLNTLYAFPIRVGHVALKSASLQVFFCCTPTQILIFKSVIALFVI